MKFDIKKARARLLSEAKNDSNSKADLIAVYLDVATAAIARIEELEAENANLKSVLLEEKALNLTWLDDPSKIGKDYEEPFYIMAKDELRKEGLLP